jgi:hypothetical protein
MLYLHTELKQDGVKCSKIILRMSRLFEIVFSSSGKFTISNTFREMF